MRGLGLCECGCGEKTKVAKRSDPRHGHVKGQPVRFIHGHHMRVLTTPERRKELSDRMRGNEIWRRRPVLRGSDHPFWKGDDAAYMSVHNWLRKHYPKAGVCESCGAEGPTDYAYQGEVGGWERDRSMYAEWCRACHTENDRERDELGRWAA